MTNKQKYIVLLDIKMEADEPGKLAFETEVQQLEEVELMRWAPDKQSLKMLVAVRNEQAYSLFFDDRLAQLPGIVHIECRVIDQPRSWREYWSQVFCLSKI